MIRTPVRTGVPRTSPAVLLLLLSPALQAQHPEHAPPEGGHLGGIGMVEFENSCSDEAQQWIEGGLALLHSFWFFQADRAFQEALRRDSYCHMAEWGRAMARLGNPDETVPSEEARQQAVEFLERARGLNPPTERERRYVDAAFLLFRDGGETEDERRLAWEEAMDELRRDYPEDLEATVFYALALLANASPADTSLERQLRAAEVLEPLLKAHPDHPGIAHYLVHAYDVPELADRGVEAALQYAEIAPRAPHALHMPSHIFTRLGMWDESIDSNLRSAEASPSEWERVHPWDYLVYAYLQQRKDLAARRFVDRARNARRQAPSPEVLVGSYNWQAIPARYAVERDAWREAAHLTVEGSDANPGAAARRFARALGKARSGDLDGGREEVARLERMRDALAAVGEEEAEYEYWARVTEAHALAAGAWILLEEGRGTEAAARADQAARIEEEVGKHPVMPGPILPAREIHGEILLRLGRGEEALEAFRRVLDREPNRGRALLHAGRAAEVAGEPGTAREYYAAYLRQTGRVPGG